MQTLRNWNVFSNSSPVEGITQAIQTFQDPAKKISIYVFGDEFTGASIAKVIETVDRINRKDADGNRQFDPSASSSSPAGVSFTVPLATTTGLTLSFAIAEGRDQPSGADASPKRISTRFSLGREPGQPKLRRGVYFIAWRRSNSKPLPSWRRYLILAAAAKTGDLPEDEITHEGYSRLTRRWNELAPADLSYVMLSVDYAAGSAMEWV